MDKKPTNSARRNDDSELIESMEEAPAQGGRSGGNLQRDIGTRADEEHRIDGKTGVTRVRASDKPEDANLPRFNQR